MAKKKRTLSRPPQRMTKRERSRWEREQRIQRNLVIIFVAIGIVSVIALAFGWYYDKVAYPGQVIAKVNGEEISRADYWDTRRLELIAEWNEILSNYNLYQTMGITMTEDQIRSFQDSQRNKLLEVTQVRDDPLNEDTVQGLIGEVLIRQKATAMGIQVTEEEVDAWLLPDAETETGPTPFDTSPVTGTLPAPTPVSTLTPSERSRQVEEQWGSAFDSLAEVAERSAVGSLGFSRRDYIDMVRYSARMSLLRQKVQSRLAEDLPSTAEQVRASHILLTERASRADEALGKLQQGESFAQVVVDYSDDTAARDQAGDLGWIAPGDGTLSPELEEAAFALTEPGELGRPVGDEAGYHILQLVERDDAGGRVHVRGILIPLDRMAVALDVLNQVQGGGQSFDQVARQSSEDVSTSAQGGDLGWIEQGDGTLSTAVEAVAFTLTEPNQISELVEDAAGYHILQLVERDETTGRIHLREILIRNAAGLAQEVVKQVQANALDFSEAVMAYSADQASVDKAGDIGWVDRGQLSPELEEAAFALTEPNQISEVVEDESGYHILQLVERDEANDRVHLRHVLVKRAQDLLEEIRRYIVEGDPDRLGVRFLEMALEYSDDTGSRSNGGDLGWFGRGMMVPEFEEAAFSLEPGHVSELVQTSFGYHIIWVQEYDPDHPLDEQATEQQVQEAFNEWFAEVEDAAVIERFPPPTATPTIAPPPTVVVPTAEP